MYGAYKRTFSVFQNSNMMAEGKPSPVEIKAEHLPEVLNWLRNVPPYDLKKILNQMVAATGINLRDIPADAGCSNKTERRSSQILRILTDNLELPTTSQTAEAQAKELRQMIPSLEQSKATSAALADLYFKAPQGSFEELEGYLRENLTPAQFSAFEAEKSNFAQHSPASAVSMLHGGAVSAMVIASSAITEAEKRLSDNLGLIAPLKEVESSGRRYNSSFVVDPAIATGQKGVWDLAAHPCMVAFNLGSSPKEETWNFRYGWTAHTALISAGQMPSKIEEIGKDGAVHQKNAKGFAFGASPIPFLSFETGNEFLKKRIVFKIPFVGGIKVSEQAGFALQAVLPIAAMGELFGFKIAPQLAVYYNHPALRPALKAFIAVASPAFATIDKTAEFAGKPLGKFGARLIEGAANSSNGLVRRLGERQISRWEDGDPKKGARQIARDLMLTPVVLESTAGIFGAGDPMSGMWHGLEHSGAAAAATWAAYGLVKGVQKLRGDAKDPVIEAEATVAGE